MYKMLIVDDNNKDRRLLREMIDWHTLGITIAGEAVNGRDALSLARELEPDLVVTDIAMPVMNGVELARQVKQLLPEAKFIFISFYEDFEFARSAIDFNVCGYVVKPFRPDEILKSVYKVLNIIKSKEKQEKEARRMAEELSAAKPVLQENFYREILFGVNKNPLDIEKRRSFLNIPISLSDLIQVLCIRLEGMGQSMDISSQYMTELNIRKMLEEKADESFLAILQTSASEFIMLRRMKEELEEDDSFQLALTLYYSIRERFSLDAAIGISEREKKLEEVHRLYLQAQRAARSEYYGFNVPIVYYAEVENPRLVDVEKDIGADKLFSQVEDLLLTPDDEEIRRFLDSFIDGETSMVGSAYLRYFAGSLVNILQIILFERNIEFKNVFNDNLSVWRKLYEFNTILNLKNWLFNILLSVKQYLLDPAVTRNGKLVGEIKQWIHQHYTDPITLRDITSGVYMSAKHANAIFKSETGKSIFEYLVDFRVREAKKMLLSGDVRIYEVAQRVGYTNQSHFCLLFKQMTGMSPKEFRDANGARSRL